MSRRINLGFGVVATALIIGSVLAVCQMVFTRHVLNQSTVWQSDFATFSLVGATFMSAPYVAMKNGHISVDIMTSRATPHFHGLIRCFVAFAALSFSALIAVAGWKLWFDAWNGRWMTATLWEIPMWIPYISLPLGMSATALHYLLDIAETFRNVGHRSHCKASEQ
jgi:TRAP-type C4-dicarboxylate transport system permease small subunit